MRQHWVLLDEEQFRYAGPDWLLLMILDECSPVQRDMVKLVLWHTWTTHNNITHQSGSCDIHDGVQTLLSMASMLHEINSPGPELNRNLRTARSQARREGKADIRVPGKPV